MELVRDKGTSEGDFVNSGVGGAPLKRTSGEEVRMLQSKSHFIKSSKSSVSSPSVETIFCSSAPSSPAEVCPNTFPVLVALGLFTICEPCTEKAAKESRVV